MKKLFKTVLIVIMCMVSVLPMKSFAADEEKILCHDAVFSEERIQEILALNPQDELSTRATDLILTYNIAIAKNGSYIDMVAKMFCDNDVVKCGFKKLVLQKRATTSSAWVNCLTLEDLYDDSFAYSVGRTFSVPSGYQYRVVCTFYAKKSLLVTQKIEHPSNVVTL